MYILSLAVVLQSSTQEVKILAYVLLVRVRAVERVATGT